MGSRPPVLQQVHLLGKPFFSTVRRPLPSWSHDPSRVGATTPKGKPGPNQTNEPNRSAPFPLPVGHDPPLGDPSFRKSDGLFRLRVTTQAGWGHDPNVQHKKTKKRTNQTRASRFRCRWVTTPVWGRDPPVREPFVSTLRRPLPFWGHDPKVKPKPEKRTNQTTSVAFPLPVGRDPTLGWPPPS